MKDKKVLFTGCSFTAGSGWDDHPDPETRLTRSKSSKHLWVNILHKNLEVLQNLELINNGVPGASNTKIFENTIQNILNHGEELDTVICQWTSGPRYSFNPGLERWTTEETLGDPKKNYDVKLSDGTVWTRAYLFDLSSRLLVLHHVHWEILKIVRYSNILQNLAKKYKNLKLYFLNGLCPWDADYFTKLEHVLPVQYTEFTKKYVLQIEHRNDEDIYYLYNKIHQDYNNEGGICKWHWINLYNSFKDNRVDVNFDDNHPGVQSNIFFSEMIADFFNFK
jgi:hypothetical protein